MIFEYGKVEFPSYTLPIKIRLAFSCSDLRWNLQLFPLMEFMRKEVPSPNQTTALMQFLILELFQLNIQLYLYSMAFNEFYVRSRIKYIEHEH